MGTPSLESNPLFPTTTIFIGNGFDLSLGLKSKYTDYFNHTGNDGNKDFWPIHDSYGEEEHLYKVLNGQTPILGSSKRLNADSTWFDLEDELKKHAKRPSPKGREFVTQFKRSFHYDQNYFDEIRSGLKEYLKHEVEEWAKNRADSATSSPAYQMMYEVCVRASAEPNIVTFNYTDINSLLTKCKGNNSCDIYINPNKIQHVHGSLLEDHIILGINEDKDVPMEYDFLFKSWDEHYNSHRVIDTLRNSQIIIFFGLSFGSIDSVYFLDFFKSIIKGTYDRQKKHIVICTYNESSMRNIYRQFFQMGISIMELKAHCDLNFLLTNPDNPNHHLKFENGKISQWLYEWKDFTLDI